MDFDQMTDQQIEKVDNEEYIDREYGSRQKIEKKPETKESKRNEVVDAGGKEVYSPSRISNKKKNKGRKKFSFKLIFKLFVVAAVCFNLKFIWNYMEEPESNFTFYHTLVVLGICAGINFTAAWLLFYKKSFIRLYVSIISILGSFGYYFYVNYMNHSFLGNNTLTSLLVLISVLMAINPKGNYYLKSITLLLFSIIGIYLCNNRFAIVWALMLSAGLILLFRMTKLKNSKSDSRKREDRTRRKQKQSA